MDSRKKKKSRKQKNPADRLRSRMAEMGLPEPKKLTVTPHGKKKMSEVILDFIGPYLPAAQSEERYRALLSVAVVAWNASLFPPSERSRILNSVIDKAMPYGSEDTKLVIEELVQRKERYFSDNKRMILSYDLTMTEEGTHLSVASSR
jgi:hypothetical protein